MPRRCGRGVELDDVFGAPHDGALGVSADLEAAAIFRLSNECRAPGSTPPVDVP